MEIEIENKNKLRIVIPGEEVAREKNGFMAGLGTYTENGIILSCLAGEVNTINKLVTVIPQKQPYKPEIGDVIIGRVLTVDKKSWRIDINSLRDANLNLTAINLPKGEQRRRSETDAMQMRNYFEENDLLSGEIQQVHSDGGVNVQTRNLKYGKLKNGIFIEVNHNLIKKMKYHFIELVKDIKAIIGRNGWIWVYYSTVKLGNEYFTDDQTKVNSMNKVEMINEYAAINIILFKNIIKSLETHKIHIDQISIMKYYELYIQILEQIKSGDKSNVKLSELEFLKNNLIIPQSTQRELIKNLKSILNTNSRNKNFVELGREINNLNKMMVDNQNDDEEEQNGKENGDEL